MKFFVTDAQLAALEAAIWAKYRQAYERWLNEGHQAPASAQHQRHEAEIQRLREDRAAELARVADPSAPFLAHLLELVAILRRDVVHERQRSEIALDQCRVTHQQIGPVSMPPREDRPPSALANAFGPGAEDELSRMGRTDP